MIIHMARQVGDNVQLCTVKVSKDILAIMKRRGFVAIDATEWNRLLAIKRAQLETEAKP